MNFDAIFKYIEPNQGYEEFLNSLPETYAYYSRLYVDAPAYKNQFLMDQRLKSEGVTISTSNTPFHTQLTSLKPYIIGWWESANFKNRSNHVHFFTIKNSNGTLMKHGWLTLSPEFHETFVGDGYPVSSLEFHEWDLPTDIGNKRYFKIIIFTRSTSTGFLFRHRFALVEAQDILDIFQMNQGE